MDILKSCVLIHTFVLIRQCVYSQPVPTSPRNLETKGISHMCMQGNVDNFFCLQSCMHHSLKNEQTFEAILVGLSCLHHE